MSQDKLRTLIQRLGENDPTLTSLDFRNVDGSQSYMFESGSDLLQDMLNALACNNTVTSVNLILRFLHRLTIEEKKQIYQAIGSLPKLENLRIGHSGGFAGFLLELVTLTISRASNNLKSLTMHSIYFKGNVSFTPTDIQVCDPLNTDEPEFLEFLAALSGMKQLESFTLEDIEERFDLDALVDTLMVSDFLPNLNLLSIRSFDFATSPRLSRKSLTALFQSKTLQSLALKRLQLAPWLSSDLLITLEDNRTIQILNLEQNLLGREFAMALAYVLRTNQSLQEVHVGYNLIPDDGGATIADSLSTNKNIKSFDLMANDLGEKTCRSFANLLQGSNSHSCSLLEYLNLAENSLRDQGVVMVVGAIKTNTTLKSLTLAETKLGMASCATLTASLECNSTIEKLNLAENKFGDDGCLCLVPALQRNTTLKALNLFGNQIGSKGVIALAKVLAEKSTLEQLNLAGNHSIGAEAYKTLVTMMVSNYSLKHLWLPTILPGSVIPSYLRLNKSNRKRLMQEMDNASLWVDVIKGCADDIHCLYFLVRANPAVVSWLP